MPRSSFRTLALACLCTAGCTSFSQLDSWPVFSSEREGAERPGRVEVLAPFFQVQWQESTVQWDLRPLVSVRDYRDVPEDGRPQFDVPFFAPTALLSPLSRVKPPRSEPGQGKSGTQVLALWPIFWHQSSEPAASTVCLLGYYNLRGRDKEGQWWHVWGQFPFYFGGRCSERGAYHAVFPFGGSMKNFFGSDEINFFLFPLYVHTRSGGRDSRYVILPFIRWGSGNGRKYWGVWPLIGRSQQRDAPPIWFYLWPFFWHIDKPAEGDRAIRGGGVFPFFLWRRQGPVSYHSVLWPIVSWGSDSSTGWKDWVVLVWFLKFGSGPNYSRFQFWPFYGTLQMGQVRRHYVLWPFYQRERRESRMTRYDGAAIFPYRSALTEQRADDGTASTARESAFWPLWYYKRDANDNAFLGVLAPLGRPDPHGWHRIYSFLWQVFEHERRTYGVEQPEKTWRSTRALWGAVRYDRDAESRFLRLFPLFSTRSERSKLTSLELLMGAFGFVDGPGTRTFRLLFVPVTVSRGGQT